MASDDPFAARHALYWLTANLSAERPLALFVDDAHWADTASMDVLVHVAHRLEGIPVALVVACRTEEPRTTLEMLRRHAAGHGTLIDLAPLSEDGAAIIGRSATWSSSNTAVASVNGSGLVSGLSPGTASIRATIDGVQGTAVVRVVPIAVAQMRVTPNTASIPQGDVVQLTGTPLDAQGNPLTGRLIVLPVRSSTSADCAATLRLDGRSTRSRSVRRKWRSAVGT